MSNCILTALYSHLSYIEITPSGVEYLIYHGIRQAAEVGEGHYTPGAITPLIYQLIARARGLDLIVQSRRGTKEFHLQCLEDEVHREMARLGNFGEEVDAVTLYPAIWCAMNVSHAFFAREYEEPLPETVIEMAFQFRRKT